jgi:hypothetical protein
MSNTFDSIDIRGLRPAHFKQLLNLVYVNEREEFYSGNKEQYWKRHEELKTWLEDVVVQAYDSNNKIPKKRILK